MKLTNIKKFFLKHYLVIILSLLVGCLTLGPQLYAIWQLGDEFKGVHQVVSGDELYYMARARDVVDGHPELANPYLFEHKDGAPMQFWLPDNILSQPLAFFGIDIYKGYFFYDFLLTAIITFLTYIALLIVTRSKWIALSGTAWLHLAYYLEGFNRSPGPQLNFIFWTLVFIFLFQYLATRKSIFFWLSTFSFGLLFHIYPYYWTFWTVAIILFLFFSLLKNKTLDKKVLLIFAGGLVVGIPYFISMYMSSKLPFYGESLSRLGMLETHFPSGLRILWPIAFLLPALGFFYYKKWFKNKTEELFLLAGSLTGIICVNQHIITGQNLEFTNHYSLSAHRWYYFLFFYLLALAWPFLRRKKVVIFFVIFFLSFQIAIYTHSAWSKMSQFSEKEILWQRYEPVLSWLESYTKKEDVVYSDDRLSNFISIYTSNNVYYCREANLFFISNQEVKHRFVMNNYWDEYSDEFLKDNERAIWGTEFINKYNKKRSENRLRRIFGFNEIENIRYPSYELEEMKDFSGELRSKDFETELKKYRVDYIAWDKKEKPNWRVESLDFVEELYEANDIVIFAVW